MREVELTSQFKKDYKRARKNPKYKNFEIILTIVINNLQNDELLAPSFHVHKLKGKYNEFEECHLKPDLLLIYFKIENRLQLIRLGSHSELFK